MPKHQQWPQICAHRCFLDKSRRCITRTCGGKEWVVRSGECVHGLCGVALTQVPFARTATFFAGGGGAMSSEPMFYVNKKKGRRRTVAAAVASEAAAFSSGAATSSSADTSHPARDQERNTGRRGLEPRRRWCLHLERVYGVEKDAVSDNHALATSRPPRARSSALRARPRSWCADSSPRGRGRV